MVSHNQEINRMMEIYFCVNTVQLIVLSQKKI